MTSSRLTFIKNVYVKKLYKKKHGQVVNKPYDLYRCECGNYKVASRPSVKSRHSNSVFSCGCLRKENIRKLNGKGLNRNPGNTSKVGRKASNKGKVAVYVDGKKRFVTREEALQITWGV
tara:strand:- start:877 stop:1233 length:357 start_codon:yes stop_codon:yes gene_type:complete